MARGSIFRTALPALTISLVLHAALGTGILARNPAHFTDPGLLQKDSKGYFLLGRNMFEHGVFSRSEQPPYVPDMVRTPVYPAVVGTASRTVGFPSMFLAHAAFNLASCVLVVAAAQLVAGAAVASLAGMLFATELSTIETSFEIETESLFLLLMLGALVCHLRWLRSDKWPGNTTLVVAAAVLAGLASLTRPSGQYLPVLFILSTLWAAYRAGKLRLAVAPVVLLVVAGYALPGAWVYRNYRVFDYPRLSTIDTHGLVFYVGGGAYELKHGVPFEEARDMISREFGLPSYTTVQNPQVGRSVVEMERQLTAVQWQVLLRYPRELLLSLAFGTFKAFLAHSNDVISTLTATPWNPPGLGNLTPGNLGNWFRRLLENPLWLVVSFVFQLMHSATLVSLAPLGLFLVARRGPPGLAVALVSLFFLATVLMFGVTAGARARSPLVPFLCLYASCALVYLRDRAVAYWQRPLQPIAAGTQ